MAERSGLEPPKSFDELVTRLERGFDSLANQVMGTDGFSQGMNTLQNTRLSLQQVVQDAMQAHLERVNMPSREDVLRLGDSMAAIERRLVRMETTLDRLAQRLDGAERAAGGAANAGGRPRPARTRKPPPASGSTP